MTMFLAHGDFAWIMSGLVVFTGLMVLFIKVARGKIVSVVLSSIVWYFVYKLHGGSTTGIMTATFAALLFDLIGLSILKLFMKR